MPKKGSNFNNIYFCRSGLLKRGRRTAKLALLLIKFIKYGIVQFLLKEYLEEGPNRVHIPNIYRWKLIWIHNRHIHLFNKDLAFLHTYHCQYFYTPTPRSKKFWYAKNPLKRSKRLWLQKLDRKLGRMWIMKK